MPYIEGEELPSYQMSGKAVAALLGLLVVGGVVGYLIVNLGPAGVAAAGEVITIYSEYFPAA